MPSFGLVFLAVRPFTVPNESNKHEDLASAARRIIGDDRENARLAINARRHVAVRALLRHE